MSDLRPFTHLPPYTKFRKPKTMFYIHAAKRYCLKKRQTFCKRNWSDDKITLFQSQNYKKIRYKIPLQYLATEKNNTYMSNISSSNNEVSAMYHICDHNKLSESSMACTITMSTLAFFQLSISCDFC